MSTRIVCLCGSTDFLTGFQFANYHETLADRIVVSIGCDTKSDAALGLTIDEKERLDQLHLRKIDLADEILVINRAGYIGRSTLHEICYAYNHQKAIRFQEPYSIFCPACQREGLEQEHFFCHVSTVEEISALADDPHAQPYLPGQLVRWMGQIVPVVHLLDGSLALHIDVVCPRCHEGPQSFYLAKGEDTFSVLVDIHGTFLADFFDADQRTNLLTCQACASLSSSLLAIVQHE